MISIPFLIKKWKKHIIQWNKSIIEWWKYLPGSEVNGAAGSGGSVKEGLLIAGDNTGGKLGGIGGGKSGVGGCSISTGASGLESPGL